MMDWKSFLALSLYVAGILRSRRQYAQDPKYGLAMSNIQGKRSHKRYLRLQEQKKEGTLKQKKRKEKQKWKDFLMAMPEGEPCTLTFTQSLYPFN